MKRNRLNHYIIDRLSSVERHLSFYKKDKNPERLHRLRVDIKKIKAVFSFAESVYREKQDLSRLKALFHEAGKIREIEINKQLLLAFSDPPKKLIIRLNREQHSLIQKFIKNISHYNRLIRSYCLEISLPEKLPDKKEITGYFKKVKRKVTKKLSDNRKSMHRFRMKIKDRMYLYSVFPGKLQKEIKWNNTEINRLQKKLGDWHDTYSAVNFFSHKQFSKKAKKYILKLKEKERKQFAALFMN